MAAGAGVLHREDFHPEQGRTEGFQLWTLLPQGSEEMGPVRYSTVQRESVPAVRGDGSVTRVLIGRHQQAISPARHSVPMTYLQVRLQPQASWQHTPAHEQSTAFVYVRQGAVDVAEAALEAGQLGVWQRSEAMLQLQAGAAGADLMVVTGQPLRQPLISSGPSVHTSEANLRQGTRRIRELAAARGLA